MGFPSAGLLQEIRRHLRPGGRRIAQGARFARELGDLLLPEIEVPLGERLVVGVAGLVGHRTIPSRYKKYQRLLVKVRYCA